LILTVSRPVLVAKIASRWRTQPEALADIDEIRRHGCGADDTRQQVAEVVGPREIRVVDAACEQAGG